VAIALNASAAALESVASMAALAALSEPKLMCITSFTLAESYAAWAEAPESTSRANRAAPKSFFINVPPGDQTHVD
jgi:hypothetical protein